MSDSFDKTEFDRYSREAKEKWGSTAAWADYEKKESARTPGESGAAAAGLMRIFSDLGGLKSLPPDSPAVREKVAELKDYLTAHYFNCTDEIFAGLGKTYAADPRFKRNIDKAGGEGTAEFTSRAIALFGAE